MNKYCTQENMQEKKFMQQLQNYFSKIEKEFSEHAFRSILQQLQNYLFKIEKKEQKNLHLEELNSNASHHGNMGAEKPC